MTKARRLSVAARNRRRDDRFGMFLLIAGPMAVATGIALAALVI